MGFFDEKTGGLITHWKSVSAITTLVGSGTAARIYPGAAKQGVEVPYITFTRIDGRPLIRLGGMVGARLSVLHVYCYGATPAAADALAEAVLENTRGMRGTYTGVIVYRVETESIDDGWEYVSQGTDQKDYWVRLIIRFIHQES